MMTMIVRLMAVVVMAATFVGCAIAGPYMADPTVYNAERDKAVAKRGAETAFWNAEGKSVKEGKGGVVERSGTKNIAPGYYQDGYVVNKSTEAVTFVIGGPVSVTVTLPAAIQHPDKRVPLMPTMSPIRLVVNKTYHLQVYKGTSQYPYVDQAWYINDQPGDGQATGLPADQVVAALTAGEALPQIETHICDFSALAP